MTHNRGGIVAKSIPGGRPPQDDDGRKVVMIQVRVTQDQRDEAEAIAQAMGVSLSDFVRMAMIEKAERYRRERE